LIEHLANRQVSGAGRSIRLDSEAMACLAQNHWPGNVRELANLLERLAILFPAQTICGADLPDRYRGNLTLPRIVSAPPEECVNEPTPFITRPPALAEPEEPQSDEFGLLEAGTELPAPQVYELLDKQLPRGGIDLKDHLSAIEIGLIRKALVEADGTVAEAARLLHIRRTTLVEKLRKYRMSA
jgi:sigma-54 specific flagellar transcriptional regulator A